MSMPRQSIVKVDLSSKLQRIERGALLATADKLANRMGAEVYQDGKAMTLTGYTVKGYFIRAGVDTITIAGKIDGNKAYIDLPESCYLYDGSFSCAVKLCKSGYEQTLVIFDGFIAQTITNNIIDSGNVLSFTDAILQRNYCNFLDNSNFQINQRGQSEYTATGYSYDRWRFRSSNGGTVQKLAKGIRITTGTSGICGVYQRIATQEYPPVFDALAGEPVTLAIKVAANTLSASGNSGIDLLDHNGTTTEGTEAVVIARKNIPNGETGIFVANGTMPHTLTNNGITALLRTPSTTVTGAIDIEWMALYKGTYTAETLPSYMPKGYAAELLECQRYYYRTNGQGYGYCTNTSAARLNIPIPVMMRAVPSVDNDSITITCHNNGNNITATGFSVAEMYGASVRLNLTSDAAYARYTPLAGYASDPFGFSADL